MAIWAQGWFARKEAQHWVWTCSTSSNEDSSSGNKKTCFGKSPPSKSESSSSETFSTDGFWRLLHYFDQFDSNMYRQLFLTSNLICSWFVWFLRWGYYCGCFVPTRCSCFISSNIPIQNKFQNSLINIILQMQSSKYFFIYNVRCSAFINFF